MREVQTSRNATLSLGNARHPKEIIAEYWDLRSHSYVKGMTASKDEEREVWKRCLAPFIADCSIQKALDVGAGTGFLSYILQEMGIDVIGMDLSLGMLSRARETSCQRQQQLDFCQGDAELVPFRSSSFDIVVSRHLLWTLPNPGRALAEWKRILKPGGRMLAIDGNWFDPSAGKKLARKFSDIFNSFSCNRNPVPFKKFYKPIERHLPLYQASQPDRCLALFKAAGLEDVSLDRLNEVNYFYKKRAGISFQLANANVIFLVKGNKC
jgi:ubiquinone/menaquinone biosynthesis C-methylase UbiE